MTARARTINHAALPTAIAFRLRARLRELGRVLEAWYERDRERRALAALSDHLLRDMGTSPDEIHRETRKPFWRD